MATDDVQRLVTGQAPAPAHFTVPGNGQIRPKAIFAHFDGTGAGTSFQPALKVISDGGETVAICPTDATLAAGASADVSWFPRVGGGGTSVLPPNVPLFPATPGMVASEHGWAEFDNAGDVLPKGASAKSFECWAKMNGDPGLHDLYFYNHGPQSVDGDTFAFEHNGNVAFAPSLGFVQGATLVPFVNYHEWNDTDWHHFVLTYAGGTTVQLYMDGAPAPPLTIVAQNVGAAQPLIIGNYKAGGSLGTALIDEMAVYSGALSQARITAHLLAALNGNYAATVLADSPIVYYRFDDAGPNLVMTDSSGNGHNGTYSGLFTPNSAANNFVYGVRDGAVV